MGISTFPAASAGGITARTLKEQVFNASGTWTYPSSSNFDGTVFVTSVGGGGASGCIVAETGSAPYGATGGGGGGRVILNKEINVLSGGNQTVTIGVGGVSNRSGFGESNGGYTIFGTPVIANYYPDPNMRRGFTHGTANTTYPEMYFTSTGSSYSTWGRPIATEDTTNSGPKTGGISSEYVQLNSNANYSMFFSVEPSKSLDLLFQYTFASTSVSQTPEIHWYNSTLVQISSTSCTSVSMPSSGSTFQTYKMTGITSPSTARYAQIRFPAFGGAITGLTLSPTSLGLTEPISGNSTNYQWSGSPENSWTVKSTGTNLANFVIAQGGASGWGWTRYTNGGAHLHCTGPSGWSAGGHAVVEDGAGSAPDTKTYLLAGHGGGAGDNAVEPNYYNAQYTDGGMSNDMQIRGGGTNNWPRKDQNTYSGTARRVLSRPYYAGGAASPGTYLYSVAANTYPIANMGRPGRGLEGYGSGGVGGFYTGASNLSSSNAFSISNTTRDFGDNNGYGTGIEANTGNGGSGLYQSSSINGQNGSSGLVIVRWYE